MKNFDIKRVWKLCKWSAYTFKGSFFASVLGLFVAILLFFIVNAFDSMGSADLYQAKAPSAAVAIFLLLATVGPGLSFLYGLKTKESRTTYLMLPASPLEKFVVGYVGTFVMILVAVVIASIAASVVNYLLSYVFSYGFHAFALKNVWGANLVVKGEYISVAQGILASAAFYLTILFIHSLYVYGATWFRKHPVILTTLALIVASVLFSNILAGLQVLSLTGVLEIDIENFVENFLEDFAEDVSSPTVLLIYYCLFMLLAASLFFWLAYRRFKKIQLTYRGILN